MLRNDLAYTTVKTYRDRLIQQGCVTALTLGGRRGTYLYTATVSHQEVCDHPDLLMQIVSALRLRPPELVRWFYRKGKLSWKDKAELETLVAASPTRPCPLRKREARGDTSRAQRLWRGSWLSGRVPWSPRRWPCDWQREMIAGLSTQRYGALRRSTEAATAKAVTTVADTVVGAGAYLQEKGGEGRTGNLAVWVRRYPSASLLIGLGVGFLLGRRLGNAATAQGS